MLHVWLATSICIMFSLPLNAKGVASCYMFSGRFKNKSCSFIVFVVALAEKDNLISNLEAQCLKLELEK